MKPFGANRTSWPRNDWPLAPYVADGIDDGMEEGGLKGLGQLSDILGGDKEALKAYVNLFLVTIVLQKMRYRSIVDNLVYANARIPKELQIAIGLDLKDPEGKTMDSRRMEGTH